MSALPQRWDYKLYGYDYFVELHPDKFVQGSLSYSHEWDLERLLAGMNICQNFNLPASILTQMYQTIAQMPAYPKGLSDLANRTVTFWKNFDPTKISPQIFPINEYNSLLVDTSGIYTINAKTQEKATGNYGQMLNDFYFYGNNQPAILLSADTRRQVLACIETGFKQFLYTYSAIRSVILDYDKLVFKSWNIPNPTDSNSGDYLELSKQGISIGGWSGRDGGGSSYTLEQFWYHPETIIPKNSLWADKVPTLLEAIQTIISGLLGRWTFEYAAYHIKTKYAIELYDNQLIAIESSYGFSFKWADFLTQYTRYLPTRIKAEILKKMSEKAPNFSGFAKEKMLFWESVDTSRLPEKLFAVSGKYALSVSWKGIFLLDTQTQKPCLADELGTDVDWFYLRGSGSQLVDLRIQLSVPTRLAIWAYIAQAFCKHLPELEKLRCVLIDYQKIVPLHHSYGDSSKGGQFDVHAFYISESTWEYRDGGGSCLSLEHFWYDSDALQGAYEWKKYYPTVKEIIANAIDKNARFEPETPRQAPPAG